MMRRVIPVLGVIGMLLAAAGCFGPLERPVAAFTWCPDGSQGELDLWFTSMSTTVPGHWIESMVWEFDDGTPPQTGWDMPHRYDEPGIYLVTLTVTDSRGVSGTVTQDVVVEMPVIVQPNWQLTLGFPPTVTGVIQSRYDGALDLVVVRAKFYDADGVRLTDERVEIEDLEPGERAAFEIRAREFQSRIFHATVEIEAYQADCSMKVRPVE